VQLHLVVIAKITILSMHKGHYLGKFENRAFPSFVTEPYFLNYTRGVDYKGLNGSFTPTIYHMTRNIECIRRWIAYKHQSYMVSTTHPVYIGVNAIWTYA
jgi:hypothetical protein